MINADHFEGTLWRFKRLKEFRRKLIRAFAAVTLNARSDVPASVRYISGENIYGAHENTP